MTDTLIAFTPNGTKPAPFAVVPKYEWIGCTEDGFEGFAAEVRVNILNGERRAWSRALADITAYSVAWMATPAEERDATDTPQRRQWALIAPYVRAWNAVLIDDETGDVTDVEPPAVAGPDAFAALYPEMSDWLIGAVVGGYSSGKGVPTFAAASARMSAPAGPRIVPDAPATEA